LLTTPTMSLQTTKTSWFKPKWMSSWMT
jgi:hypothetical protein